ncbi:MAG: site-specific DNA-methyltransferase [Methylobacter sp.]
MSKHDDLVKKLKEIFQIDKPELDFGVYRILNARVGEINDYLENRLKSKVSESLLASGAATMEGVQKELAEKEAQYRADGIDPETVPKVRELRQKLAEYGVGTSEHENAVFTHLLTFFSRYYDNGDFVSQRRYKGDTYAIPYAGEEVVLHWANKDQYYTKSGENFSNYAFKLDDGRSVRFRLITADTAKDNRKDNDKERRFVLIEQHTRILTDDEGDEYQEELKPVAEENGELVLRFEYKAMPKGCKQDALVLDAVKQLLADPIINARWLDLSKREPTEKNPQRTLLEKCLTSYTSKNSADYFIHKDLGGFLRRELDFYIKNEVMHLDDVQNAEKFADIEKNLRLIQTLRAIALDLVTFLAQLEDFQKKLWLKKKFVVATHYCITLDRVPESLYSTIAANSLQWEQWKNLGMLNGKVDLVNQAEVGCVDYLKEHPYLMADSSLFNAEFKFALLAAMDDLDNSLDGLLIHGDNFQALNLLQERYRKQINGIYIDPPYNTDASAIMYKNGYKDSSWLSLMHNRLELAHSLMRDDALISVAIDDQEVASLRALLGEVFEKEIGVSVVKSNPQSRKTTGKFSPVHEYALFYGKTDKALPCSIGFNDSKASRYPLTDEIGRYSWMNFIRAGSNDLREDRPKLFYPISVNNENKIRIPRLEWNEELQEYKLLEEIGSDEQLVYPIKYADDKVIEKNWQRGHKRVADEYDEYRVRRDKNGDISIDFKTRMDAEAAPVTWWDKGEYASANYGASELKDLFSEKNFDFPKARKLVEDALRACGVAQKNTTIIDFFGGSGTTAHAVISISRDSKEKHSYVLVEQGEYFDTIIKPRIQKVVYSSDWKDGKPISLETGISHAFKVLKIESYEDTLNNMQLRRTTRQSSLLDMLPESAQEDYLLRYLLDIESRGSLLSVEQFNQPFDCKLKVTVDSAGAYEERTIDLVETVNYLIGLRVEHINMQRDEGFVSITGWLPTGEKTLVFWRDCEKISYDVLWSEQDLTGKERAKSVLGKLDFNPRDTEFEIVYINGDHNIPAVFTSTEAEGGITKTLKIRQIEPEFLSHMFAEDGM